MSGVSHTFSTGSSRQCQLHGCLAAFCRYLRTLQRSRLACALQRSWAQSCKAAASPSEMPCPALKDILWASTPSCMCIAKELEIPYGCCNISLCDTLCGKALLYDVMRAHAGVSKGGQQLLCKIAECPPQSRHLRSMNTPDLQYICSIWSCLSELEAVHQESAAAVLSSLTIMTASSDMVTGLKCKGLSRTCQQRSPLA